MKIYWDSMLFSYMLEADTAQADQLRDDYRTICSKRHRLVTSTFTIGEVLVSSVKKREPAMYKAVHAFFHSGEVLIVPLDVAVAETFATIRATSDKVNSADAIHLATAALQQVDVFMTNDHALQKLKVSGIGAIQGIHRVRL
jgi:predicted nucleic acid-binding protein